METTARTATLSEPDPHNHGDYMAMETTATPPGRRTASTPSADFAERSGT